MPRFIFLIFAFIFLGSLVLVHGQERNEKFIVVIDPGHGGCDTGAIGVNGIEEKAVALKIAMEVLRLNKALYADTFEVYSTRYTDTLISLGHRTKLANALDANVFVSIHCNRSARRAAQGVEVYIRQADEISELLANQFLENLDQSLGYKTRGVHYGDFQVLRESTDCPSVLLELGFLSNTAEAAHNVEASSTSAHALLILETLIKFMSYD